MTGINLKTNLKDYGISSEEDIRFIADNVNTERLGNNPRSLTNYELLSILRNNL
jgi:alcohol dehydrogenase class IV